MKKIIIKYLIKKDEKGELANKNKTNTRDNQLMEEKDDGLHLEYAGRHCRYSIGQLCDL